MLVDAVMKTLKLQDRMNWPRPGEIRMNMYAETGFPIVYWTENQLTPPQACLASIENNVPMFVVADVASVRMSESRNRRPPLSVKWRAWAIMAGLMVLPSFLWWLRWQDYRNGDDTAPVIVFVGALFYEVLLLGAFYGIRAFVRSVRQRAGMTDPTKNTEYRMRPWQDLQAFAISDERSIFGRSERDSQGRELPPRSVLVANFGGASEPLMVTGFNWSPEVLRSLHSVLTREFIEQREECLRSYMRRTRTAHRDGMRSQDGGPAGPVEFSGRAVPADIVEDVPQEDQSEPRDEDGKFVIPVAAGGDAPGVGFLVPFHDRHGEVVQQYVTQFFDEQPNCGFR